MQLAWETKFLVEQGKTGRGYSRIGCCGRCEPKREQATGDGRQNVQDTLYLSPLIRMQENLKVLDHFRDLGVHGTIILKRIFKK